MIEKLLLQEEALREGNAIKQMAKDIAERKGLRGGPTGVEYKKAFSFLKDVQLSNHKRADAIIDEANIWAEIENEIGREETKRLEVAMYNMIDEDEELTERCLPQTFPDTDTRDHYYDETRSLFANTLKQRGDVQKLLKDHQGIAEKAGKILVLTIIEAEN